MRDALTIAIPLRAFGAAPATLERAPISAAGFPQRVSASGTSAAAGAVPLPTVTRRAEEYRNQTTGTEKAPDGFAHLRPTKTEGPVDKRAFLMLRWESNVLVTVVGHGIRRLTCTFWAGAVPGFSGRFGPITSGSTKPLSDSPLHDCSSFYQDTKRTPSVQPSPPYFRRFASPSTPLSGRDQRV